MIDMYYIGWVHGGMACGVVKSRLCKRIANAAIASPSHTEKGKMT